MAQKFFTFEWRIEDFSCYWQKLNQVEIVSPEFHVNYTTGTTKWRLVFSDSHVPEKRFISRNDKYVRLYFQRTDGNARHSVALIIDISFVKVDKTLFTWRIRLPNITAFKDVIILNDMETILSKRDVLLPKDVLTVRCRMTNWSKMLNLIEGHCFARTLLEIERMHFVAVVEEFSDLIPRLKRTVSIKSTSVEQPIFSMNLCLSDEGKLNISFPVEANCIYLCLCTMLVLHSSGNWEKCGQDSEWRKYGEVCEFPLTLDFKTLIDKHNYLQNGVVTLKCEVTYTTEAEPQRIETIKYGLDSSEILQQISPCVKNTPAPETKKGSLQSPSTLIEDLVSLYKEGTLCDTKLRTETETFPAHKAVLSARSPVFKKMFTTDMREKTIDCVDIQDVNADTMRKFLTFIYTDTVDLMDWQNAKELYFVADKYEIVSLKLKCSSFLKLNIRPSNCCDILLLSDMHLDANLKRFVQDYIITRDQDVFRSDEWRNFVANHAQLAADTMCLKYERK